MCCYVRLLPLRPNDNNNNDDADGGGGGGNYTNGNDVVDGDNDNDSDGGILLVESKKQWSRYKKNEKVKCLRTINE